MQSVAGSLSTPTLPGSEWWRSAVVYQVYLRSFADGSGDGIGDIAGLRAKIGYLADLGVDALWINPWYPSPQADGGYDVADFRAIAPEYGDLEQADALINEAHSAGLRVVLDIVPNHTSSDHAWFQAALAGDLAARDRYIFRPGRGESGELAPNDWLSNFGGPAWTRVTDDAGRPGDWYLHLFAPAQPDLNWENPEVREEFEDVLRFWFERDVDGFRIDVAHGLVKEAGLPDAGERGYIQHNEPHPAWDQDGVHEIYRGWRQVAEQYDDKVFVAEAWVRSNERLAQYLRPDELHTAFQFDFLRSPFRADSFRQIVDDARAQAAEVGAVPSWVLSNHDVVRHVTRYARSQPEFLIENDWERGRWSTEPADLDLGRRRAGAAALLMLALPGTAYLYQGEELGLAEVEDVPDEHRRDPVFVQSGGADVGRDGCRVPLPWTASGPTYGFSLAADHVSTWLPQPDGWGAQSAEAQESDPGSTLNLYRSALRARRELLRGDASFEWLEAPAGTLAFRRGSVECWVNTGEEPVTLPAGRVLATSAAGASTGTLPPSSAAWVLT